MGERTEKRYTWVLKKFSTLEDSCYYSRPFPFAGSNWHILAYPKGNDGSCEHLSVFLGLIDPQSLPSGWRREIKFRFTVVNKKYYNRTEVLDGQTWFDESHSCWGYEEVLPVSRIRCRDEGFLIGDRLTIVAELHVFPVVVVPEETVKVIEVLSTKEGDVAVETSVDVVQKTENAASKENLEYDDVSKKNPCVDTSEEGLVDGDQSEEGSDVINNDEGASEEGSDDDGASEVGSGDDDASEVGSGDDDASEEGSDDDDSSLVSDGGDREKSLPNQSNTLECNSVVSETEVTNVDNDDAPRDDDDTSSLVSSVSGKNASSLNKMNSMEDVSQKVGNGDTGCDNVTFVTKASSEIQPVNETMDVNGFQVFSSEVESVRHIFKMHPDIALGFRPKNQQIRKAYMNELRSLIKMLCQSPEKLSEDDLSNADDTLVDLIDVGFKLDWLKIKLHEVSEKKKIVQGSGARLKIMKEHLQKLKRMLQKEKAEYISAQAPLSFKDVVC